MADNQARNGKRGSPSAEIQVLISMFASVVLWTAVTILVIAIVGIAPPRLVLTGTTWQWTGSTTGAGETPLVVPDRAAYAVQFKRDGTYAATADCDQVSGTFRVFPAGRAGGATNGLTLAPAPAGPAACGPESLADQFALQLGSASRYAIGGSRLTITLAPRGTMTFEAAVPVVSPSPGG
jgi:heat shock protein HslJ